MADTPIPQQQGLSQEELDSMTAVEQKYHEVGSHTISPQTGIRTQREQLYNLILKCLIDFDKARAKASPTDKYANDTCIDKFATDMVDAICDTIKGQMWNVTTSVSTDVTTPGWDGKTEGRTVNVIAPNCVTNE